MPIIRTLANRTAFDDRRLQACRSLRRGFGNIGRYKISPRVERNVCGLRPVVAELTY